MKFVSYLKKKIIYANKYRKYINRKFPVNIEIGTNSLCNGFCRICPYTNVYNILPKGSMDKELFKKIIDECSKYKIGYVSPFLFNEPFTDPNIIERIKYIAEKIPKTKIIVATNASLLNEKKSNGLLNVLRKGDIVSFSFHGSLDKENYKKEMPGLNFDETVENIKNFLKLSKGKGLEIDIQNRTIKDKKELKNFRDFWENNGLSKNNIKDSELLTRAENVDIGKEKRISNKLFGCVWHRPLINFHILNNGDVILCCMDWKCEVILGNVKKQSIYEIWNSKKYKYIRKIIYGKGKINGDFICKRCEIAN